MTERLPPLSPDVCEQLARALGEAASGSELTAIFRQTNLLDPLGEGNTKWKRINAAFELDQRSSGQASGTLGFAKAVMSPARFVSATENFEARREEVNRVLAFAGLWWLLSSSAPSPGSPIVVMEPIENRQRNDSAVLGARSKAHQGHPVRHPDAVDMR